MAPWVGYWNVFRVCGDFSHLTAIIILLLQLQKAKNARGISVKTQELRLLVFCTRYLDLFTYFYSWSNAIFKITYIVATAVIIVRIKYTEPIKSVYNANQDSFPHWKFAVAPCALLALITHLWGNDIGGFNLMDLLWTYSIYQESIAILPQLMVLQKYGLVENLTGKFVFFLGLYRCLYIFNWIYRANTERRYRHRPVVYVCGVVQTLLYTDFFYQYCKALHCCRPREARNDVDEEEDSRSLLFEITQQHPGGDDTMVVRKGRLTMTEGVSDDPLLPTMTEGEGGDDPLLLVTRTEEHDEPPRSTQSA